VQHYHARCEEHLPQPQAAGEYKRRGSEGDPGSSDRHSTRFVLCFQSAGVNASCPGSLKPSEFSLLKLTWVEALWEGLYFPAVSASVRLRIILQDLLKGAQIFKKLSFNNYNETYSCVAITMPEKALKANVLSFAITKTVPDLRKHRLSRRAVLCFL